MWDKEQDATLHGLGAGPLPESQSPPGPLTEGTPPESPLSALTPLNKPPTSSLTPPLFQ